RTETRSFHLTRRRGDRGEVAWPGYVHLEAERSSSGSMSVLNVVSSGGIHAQPAAEAACRGRPHPANPDPPGTNHSITGCLNTPRSLRSARDQEPPSAPSEPPRSPRLRVSPYCSAPRCEPGGVPAGRMKHAATPNVLG